MAQPLSRGIRAPVEHVYRSVLKHHFLNKNPPPDDRPANEERPEVPKIGRRMVLPPYLGEMGLEIRFHLARIEPWLRNGWRIVARHPELYPPGSTVPAPEYFARCDEILKKLGIVPSFAGIHIPPMEFGQVSIDQTISGGRGNVGLKLSDVAKVASQALAEIELRKLFLEWFDYKGRPLTDYDRDTLGFSPTAVGTLEYRLASALRPSYLPAPFLDPPEPMRPHVGVQMRAVKSHIPQPRNSNPAYMIRTAQAIGEHLGLPVLAYGHPEGCHIPEELDRTWGKGPPESHFARELGFLASCKLMLAPDSGWADLMAWLGVPTLLERLVVPTAYESLRHAFAPRLAVIDRDARLAPQIDALLSAEMSLPALAPDDLEAAKRFFPWEP